MDFIGFFFVVVAIIKNVLIMVDVYIGFFSVYLFKVLIFVNVIEGLMK